MPNQTERITQEQAFTILEPHIPTIADIYTQSMEDLNAMQGFFNEQGKFPKYGNTFKANFIHSHSTTYASERFSSIEGISTSTIKRVFYINFNGQFYIRFKKLDKNLQSGNVITKQSVALNHQWEIPGFPARLPIIEAGYIPNVTYTSIDEMFFVYRIDKPKWSIPVITSETTQIELPLEEIEEDTNFVKRIKLKDIHTNINRKEG